MMIFLKKVMLGIVFLLSTIGLRVSLAQTESLPTKPQSDTTRVRTPSSVGFRIGFTLNRFSISNADEADKNGIGAGFPLLNGFYNYQLNSTWSVQSELGMMCYRSSNTLYKIANVSGTVDYSAEAVEASLLGIYTYPLPNPKFTLKGELGAGVGYIWNATGTVNALNLELGTRYVVNSNSQFNTVSVGALLGVSLQYHFRSVYLIGSMRYRQGLTDLNNYDPTTNRYLAYGERRILPQNLIIQWGIGIPILKKSTHTSQ